MMEVWHPLGVVGVISGVQFSRRGVGMERCARAGGGQQRGVKPSEKTPLTALATQAIFARAVARFGDAPDGLAQLLIGGREAGESAGRRPARRAAVGDRIDADGGAQWRRGWPSALRARILELGGNNGVIVAPSADLDLALRGVAFGAMRRPRDSAVRRRGGCRALPHT